MLTPALLALALGACTHAAPFASDAAPIPLVPDLGTWHHAIATKSKESQAYFDQGLRLHYAFHAEAAYRSFAEAARRDPTCALCRWGMALALGPSLNTPADPSRAQETQQHLAAAAALATTPAERDLVEATRTARLDGLTKKYPKDPDVLALAAEAEMNRTPWDFWTADRLHDNARQALAWVDAAIAAAPGHPGAHHFRIHLLEGGPHPEQALPDAQLLPSLMPGAGHLVHMPAHVFIRTGDYAAASAANERAVAVDQQSPLVQPESLYGTMYAAHNLQFLWYSALMEGRAKASLQAARAIQAMFPEAKVKALGEGAQGMDLMLALPLYTLVRFEKWKELLEEPAPPAAFAYETAMWRWARAWALAATGRLAEAQQAHAQFVAFVQTVPADVRVSPTYSARQLLAVATLLGEGMLQQRAGHLAEAAAALALAREAEDALGYDEPPAWWLSSREQQGRLALLRGDPAGAAAFFREDLARRPENGFALKGLVQALQAEKKGKEAAAVEARWKKAWARAD
jgi:hypothetical protein